VTQTSQTDRARRRICSCAEILQLLEGHAPAPARLREKSALGGAWRLASTTPKAETQRDVTRDHQSENETRRFLSWLGSAGVAELPPPQRVALLWKLETELLSELPLGRA